MKYKTFNQDNSDAVNSCQPRCSRDDNNHWISGKLSSSSAHSISLLLERFHFPLHIRFECDEGGGQNAQNGNWIYDSLRDCGMFFSMLKITIISHILMLKATHDISLPRCVSPNKKVKLLLENNSFHIGLLIFHGSLMPGERVALDMTSLSLPLPELASGTKSCSMYMI